MLVRVSILLLALGLQATTAVAQGRQQTRDGFWFNGGAGFGSRDCRDCDRQSGVTVAIGAGGTLSRNVLVGASIDAWTQSGGTVAVLLARLRFYPSVTSGFFLTGGLGLGRWRAEGTDANSSDTGTGELIGLGYDIRVSPNLSLTPFWNWFAMQTTNQDHNVGQLGLSLTVH